VRKGFSCFEFFSSGACFSQHDDIRHYHPSRKNFAPGSTPPPPSAWVLLIGLVSGLIRVFIDGHPASGSKMFPSSQKGYNHPTSFN